MDENLAPALTREEWIAKYAGTEEAVRNAGMDVEPCPGCDKPNCAGWRFKWLD